MIPASFEEEAERAHARRVVDAEIAFMRERVKEPLSVGAIVSFGPESKNYTRAARVLEWLVWRSVEPLKSTGTGCVWRARGGNIRFRRLVAGWLVRTDDPVGARNAYPIADDDFATVWGVP